MLADEALLEMQEQVSEAFLLQRADNRTLKWLINIAIASIKDNRYPFPNPLDEPVLWVKFMEMVDEALEEAKVANAEISKAQEAVLGDVPGLKFPLG